MNVKNLSHTTKDIIKYRLANHHLAAQSFKTPQDVVAWMGAVQAQDFYGAKWALAQRMKNADDKLIEDAFSRGDIIRTHLMRPTWHFVAPADVRWLLMLTAPRIMMQCATAYRIFELDKATIQRSHKVLTKSLQGGRQLTRDEVAAVLQQGKINIDGLRFIHLLMRAELEGIICSGARQGKQFTYTLLEERIPHAAKFSEEEALAALTQRYFTSHGPATLHDFAWWSGLTLAMAKEGMEMVKENFMKETIGKSTFWMADSLPRVKNMDDKVWLLPNYDEYIVGYKDRDALLPTPDKKKLDSRGNVLFSNTIMLNGYIVGAWKRTIKKKDVTVETTLFRKLAKSENIALDEAVETYKGFIL